MSRADLYANAPSGIVTPTVAGTSDVPESTLTDWRAREGWARPFRGATVLPGTDLTAATRMAAAVAAIGAPVALTGWSAAYLRGLVRVAPTRIDLTVPNHRAPRRAGVRVRRTSDWRDDAIVIVNDLPTVSWGWMLADLAAETEVPALVGWAFDGLHEGQLAPTDLAAELTRRGRFPGRGRVGALVDTLTPDGSESGFEHRVRRRLGRHGLRPDPAQAVVRAAGRERRIDIPWQAVRVGIECHSFRYHGGREAFEEDSRRRNDLVVDGDWQILELTWRTFEQRWDPFLDQLRRLLRRRGALA
jgi:hypothetical protein